MEFTFYLAKWRIHKRKQVRIRGQGVMKVAESSIARVLEGDDVWGRPK